MRGYLRSLSVFVRFVAIRAPDWTDEQSRDTSYYYKHASFHLD